jgi:multisubunit Na+/H+ antiporter MnhC subunit
MIPLSWYLLVAALLFSIGLYGVMVRRNAVAILMSVELMLNAVNINLIAFWRYGSVLSPATDTPTTGGPGLFLCSPWLRLKRPLVWL